ncbi:uncharacterized protein [Coffea arabica]|uniref:Uncharacterized protein isoform X2 n=1 Tax=Coffea arabica TaxID=13443 RepID=A0ABM4WYJ0_COFAR
MNWAKFVLDELVIGIRNAQMMKDEQVDGFVVFFMLFYMEHFSIHGDAYIPLHIRAKPWVQFWGIDRLQRRISRLKHLGVMDGIEVEVIVDDSVWYTAQHGKESQNCNLGKRMNEVEDSTRELKEEYKEIRDSMCSMAQSLKTMQDAIVGEMKRFIERAGDKEAIAISLGEGNGNAVNSKNGMCKNYLRKYKPKCNPVCFKEPIAWNIFPQTENQENDLTSKFVEYERDTSIDVTSPVKVDNVEVVAEKEASLRVSSMDDKLPRKTCINKALGLANPDSEMSSTGSVKARLLSMTSQGVVPKHKIQISPASKRLFKKKNASPKPKKCAAIEEALSYGVGRGHKGDMNNYKFTRPENCPKQGNGNDCGVYIAKFMEHCGDVKSSFKLHVTSLDHLRIAFDLFLDLGNEVRHLCMYDFCRIGELVRMITL